MLGGKGANQAVALAQFGSAVALVGLVGDDPTAADLLAQAERDGVETCGVVRRPSTETGLVVDIVDGDGHWHYLEDLPEPVLLTATSSYGMAAGSLSPSSTPRSSTRPVRATRSPPH